MSTPILNTIGECLDALKKHVEPRGYTISSLTWKGAIDDYTPTIVYLVISTQDTKIKTKHKSDLFAPDGTPWSQDMKYVLALRSALDGIIGMNLKRQDGEDEEEEEPADETLRVALIESKLSSLAASFAVLARRSQRNPNDPPSDFSGMH